MNEFADLTTDELLERLETLKGYYQEALDHLEASEQGHWGEESQIAAYDEANELADKMHKLEWEIKERWAKEDESQSN